MKVLVAIEPRSYREVIGLAIEELRPHLQVEIVEPGALQSKISRLRPDLVLCGGSEAIPQFAAPGAKAWIEFRPYAAAQATVCLGGELSEIEDVNLDDILCVVDAVESLQDPRTPKRGIAIRGKRCSAFL